MPMLPESHPQEQVSYCGRQEGTGGECNSVGRGCEQGREAEGEVDLMVMVCAGSYPQLLLASHPNLLRFCASKIAKGDSLKVRRLFRAKGIKCTLEAS